MAGFAPPPLTDAVKKVDRAVARLEELQSTIKSRSSNGDRQRFRHEQSIVRQKVDVHVDKKPTTRLSTLSSGKDVKCPGSEKERRHCSTSAGLVDGRVPEIVEAMSRVGRPANKENVGAKKKRRKKSLVPGLAELSPHVPKPPQRRVLGSCPVNVVAELPLSSGSEAKLSIENRQSKAGDTMRNSNGRPPWKSVTVISTNNRHPTTIAERVRPNSAATTEAQNGAAGLGCSEHSSNGKGQRRVSLPVSGRTSKAGAAVTRPLSSAQESIDFAKTFCVDVRPDPNRPWRLAPKLSNIARPLVMFPNPAFRSYADEGACADVGVVSSKLHQASPKLTPFKSFQIKPLKLSSLQQQPSFLSPPATIRPYLSPSKTSPRQSQRQEDDPLAYLFGSKVQSSGKKPLKESNVPSSKKESWLSKRLSLPRSPSSSFIKRFSLLHNKKTNNTTHSPVKPLPSLITRLPTRNKPTSIDSLLNTPPPGPGKPLSNSPTVTPLISPLPLPPVLRVLSSKSHNLSPNKLEVSPHKLSSSCHLHAEDCTRNKDQRDNVAHRSLSGRGLRDPIESFRKKPSHGFPGRNSSSVWPSIKRSSSSCQPRSLDCTTNCTGAGPCLYKHVRGWMLNHKPSGSQVAKESMSGR